MNQDIYCPFCHNDFDDGGNWEGFCPTCGKQWHRYVQYYEEIFDCPIGYEIEWEDQDL